MMWELPGVERVETGPEGRSVVWRVAGTGRPLVLLHGGYGSWTHWRRNIAELADMFQVLVPDMPGYGESDDPQDLADHVSIAAPVLAGIDQLLGSQAPFDLVAFSFGGNIAGEIGLRTGDRLGHLVLVGAGGLRLPRPPSVELVSWRHLETPEAQAQAHRRNLIDFMFHDPAVADDEAVSIQATNAARARVRSRPISRRGALHDALGRFPARLHGIWGEEDVTSLHYLTERAAFLRQCDPLSTFFTVPAAGHWVQYEAAGAVNRQLQQLLANRGD